MAPQSTDPPPRTSSSRELKYVTKSTFEDLHRAIARGFQEEYHEELLDLDRREFDLDRMFGFKVGRRWVATCGDFGRRLTVPGGAAVASRGRHGGDRAPALPPTRAAHRDDDPPAREGRRARRAARGAVGLGVVDLRAVRLRPRLQPGGAQGPEPVACTSSRPSRSPARSTRSPARSSSRRPGRCTTDGRRATRARSCATTASGSSRSSTSSSHVAASSELRYVLHFDEDGDGRRLRDLPLQGGVRRVPRGRGADQGGLGRRPRRLRRPLALPARPRPRAHLPALERARRRAAAPPRGRRPRRRDPAHRQPLPARRRRRGRAARPEVRRRRGPRDRGRRPAAAGATAAATGSSPTAARRRSPGSRPRRT